MIAQSSPTRPWLDSLAAPQPIRDRTGRSRDGPRPQRLHDGHERPVDGRLVGQVIQGVADADDRVHGDGSSRPEARLRGHPSRRAPVRGRARASPVTCSVATTRWPASRRCRVSSPLPQPSSTTRPRRSRTGSRSATMPGAHMSAWNPKPAVVHRARGRRGNRADRRGPRRPVQFTPSCSTATMTRIESTSRRTGRSSRRTRTASCRRRTAARLRSR